MGRGARTLGDAHRTELLDAPTEYLLWQTLVGAWPITGRGSTAYLVKAMREAKRHTTWTAPTRPTRTAVRLRTGPHARPAVSALDAWTEAH